MGVGEGTGVTVGRSGLAVGDGVLVDVGVGDSVGAGSSVSVGVGAAVSVAVGIGVAVLVGDGVSVVVGVGVLEGVAVCVAVSVLGCVGAGEGVAVGRGLIAPHRDHAPYATAAIASTVMSARSTIVPMIFSLAVVKVAPWILRVGRRAGCGRSQTNV